MTTDRTPTGLTLLARSEAETDALGASIADLVRPGTVLGLVGPLGSGKTRLSRSIAEALGADPSAIASPTYVLIHEYEARIPVYHFDTYRLSSADEFDALGASEYLLGDGLCLVEWADRVADRLPPSTWWITIEAEGDSSRRFRLEGPGPWADLAALWPAERPGS